MQTKSTSYGKKLLALMLSLLMLVSVLPVSAWAATDAKPEKITLVGSSDALEYEFVNYLTFAWNESPITRSTSPPGPRRSSSTAPSIWIRPAAPAAATRRRTV